MKRIFFLLSISLLIFFTGCEKDEPVVSPQANLNDETIAAFKQNLEAEIQSENGNINLPEGSIKEISEPTIITVPGIYMVVNDFTVSSGDGIVINSNHVLLWAGHHTIIGPGNKEGRGIVLEGVEHVLVWGGKLETFGIGVALENTIKSAIKNVSVSGGDEFADPPNGIPPQIGILLLNSNKNHILHNSLQLINLGIFVRGPESYNNKIFLNKVKAETNGLLAICYNPAPDAGPEGPTNDKVFLNNLDSFGVGISTSEGSAENTFRLNIIRYFNDPWTDANGTNIFRHNRVEQISP
jgi:hypothetical protein